MSRPHAGESYFEPSGAEDPTPEELAADGSIYLNGEPRPQLEVVSVGNLVAPLDVIRGDAVEKRSIAWVEKPLVQASAFILLAGRKGCGKGTYVAKVAAKMTRGIYGKPQNVLFVSSEDSAAIDLVPRLDAAGADLARAHIISSHVVLPRDLDALRETAAEIGDVGLIVIDPLGNHLGGADTDKEGPVRNAISGLNQLADELGCTILGIRHLAKTTANGSLAAVLGSTAWIDLPRQVNIFARDDEDDMVFHVQVQAGNRSAHGAGESFRLELRQIADLAEPVTYAAELGASTKDVDELLAAPKRTSKSQTARELILDILEADGPQESDGLDARIARETGLNARTIQNQRVALKNEGLIRNVPEKDEHGEIHHWKVARTGAPRS